MTTSELLLAKSKEAFLLAIEIYNKPTIKYRAEGFAMFMVNAWELMLKAHLVDRDGESAIYYSDNKDRTISLENCIRKIFTNEKDPLRMNLEKIIELRNTSTHFITEEYETLYVPLFQANVFNFADKIKEFHEVDIADIIPENFLTLSVSLSQLSEREIKAKYSGRISEKLIELTNQARQNFDQPSNNRFAIAIEHYHYITKKASNATSSFRIAKNAEEAILVVKQQQDPNQTHPYNAKRVHALLNKRLKSQDIQLRFRGNITDINQYHFKNLCQYYNIKDNEKYCYKYTRLKMPQYSYSQAAVDFLFSVLENNPERVLEKVVPEKKV